MKPTMNNQEFIKVIDFLPDGFTWGSALTPAIALHIINAARAAQKNEELFATYELCNQMDALYDLDVGNVAKRANDLIEKAFMPRDQALKLAVKEYITAAQALPTQLLSNPLQLPTQAPVAYRVIASVNGDVVRDSLEFTRMSEIDEKVVRNSYDLEIIPLYSARKQEPERVKMIPAPPEKE